MANVAFFLCEKGRVEMADELQHELIKSCTRLFSNADREKKEDFTHF